MATSINLLDWRAARREQRKKEFFVMLGTAAVAGAVVVGSAVYAMNTAIENQQARNRFLQQEIAALDRAIKEIEELEKVRASLLARMRVIEELQASRSATVHFFDEIVNTLPDGVHLTSIKQSGQNVTIDGIAESTGRVSAYMKSLDASQWFQNPRLIVIRATEQDRVRRAQFQLQVRSLVKPEAADAGREGGQ